MMPDIGWKMGCLPGEIAARFHHKLAWIHLLHNSNGRHARLAADTLLVDVLSQEPFRWGKGDLYEDGEIHRRYIGALRAADQHDYTLLLSPLFDLRQEHCVAVQKNSPKARKVLLVGTNKLLKKNVLTVPFSRSMIITHFHDDE